METLLASDHAIGFTCSRCGACCRVGWAVRLDAWDAGVLRAAAAGSPLEGEVAAALAPDAGGFVLSRPDPSGPCTFLEAAGCRLHAALGPGALPTPCRNFPVDVVAVPWGREAYLELTCPTAVEALAGPPFAILRDPAWERPHDARRSAATLRAPPGGWSAWIAARRELLARVARAWPDPWFAAAGLAEWAAGRPVPVAALKVALAADPIGAAVPGALAEAWSAARPFLARVGRPADAADAPVAPFIDAGPGLDATPVVPGLACNLLAHKVFQGGVSTGLPLDRAVVVALWTLAYALRYARGAEASMEPAQAARAGVIAAEMLVHASLRELDLGVLAEPWAT